MEWGRRAGAGRRRNHDGAGARQAAGRARGPPLGARPHRRDFVDGQLRRGGPTPPPPTVGDGVAHPRVTLLGTGQTARCRLPHAPGRSVRALDPNVTHARAPAPVGCPPHPPTSPA
ncbi:hypothetical protein CF645_37430, partial [Burkholderia pseudomallei]